MNREEQISELLQRILETGEAVDVACAQSPELIPAVERRLSQLHKVEQFLDNLFPTSVVPASTVAYPATLPVVAGYDIESILGSGGMGVVYKARHQKLNRVVALKMLRAGHLASATDLSRFLRECQTIAQMHCDHIIQVHEIGDASGNPYFTMEYVDGGSLADKLRGMPQPAHEAAELVRTIAQAIHSAHERGIIHRDLKPSNILLTRELCPKVVDFGLARQIKCDHPITLSGVQLGTPSYMAPEMASGKSEVGPAADIYSLGAVLYELLTGRPPFRAQSPLETLKQVTTTEPVAPTRMNPSVPRDLETICLKCLSKQPSARYATAAELAADLQRFLQHEPILARKVHRIERVWRWSRRNPAKAGLTLTAIALGCLIGGVIFREAYLAQERMAESENWDQRMEFVYSLEQQGRFSEARSILARLPVGSSNELQQRIQRAQTELKLAEQMQAIRMNRGTFVVGGGIDYEQSSRQYTELFRSSGIGGSTDDVSSVAQRIASSPIKACLIEALDDWAVCASLELRAWILAVTRAADPDPWRDEVRNQEKWPSLVHLDELARTANTDQQPVTLMVAMGTRWRRLGGDPRVFLKGVHQHHPNDFWLNFELAHLHHDTNSVDALAYNLAALAIRPNAAAVHFNLASTYQRLNRTTDAIAHYRRVIQLEPHHSWAEFRLAVLLADVDQSDEAWPHFQKALEIDPGYKDARNYWRIALINTEQLQAAVPVWQPLLVDPTALHADIDGLAELCLYLDRVDDYDQACQVMLERFGSTKDPQVMERIGRACLLRPKDDLIAAQAHQLIRRAVDARLSAEQQWARPYLLFALALSHLRSLQFDLTLELLDGEAGKILPPGPAFLRAIALKRLGKIDEAQDVLDKAELQLREAGPPIRREIWLYEILRREAQ